MGATRPKLIKEISNLTHNNLDIYTPGIGTQGGDVSKSVKSGANYIIVGRSILNSRNPSLTTSRIRVNSWQNS